MKMMKKILTNIWFWSICLFVSLLICSWISFFQYFDICCLIISVIFLFYEITEKQIHQDFDNDLEDIKMELREEAFWFIHKLEKIFNSYKVVDHEKD